MKIAICEDEKIFSDQLVTYIKEWAESNKVFVEPFVYSDAESFLFEWSENEDFDIVFLDIKMKKMTGYELAGQIRKTNDNIVIVFATGLKGYAIQGYSVGAMQYLVKPIKKSDFFVCLNRAHKNKAAKKYYIINDSDRIIKIPVAKILYVEMSSHNATMVTLEHKYIFRKTVTQILNELDDDLFIKCHKSFIINTRHIESFSKTSVVMTNRKEIPLNRNIINEISDKFIKYNTNKI